jgi:hypothetical protein
VGQFFLLCDNWIFFLKASKTVSRWTGPNVGLGIWWYTKTGGTRKKFNLNEDGHNL